MTRKSETAVQNDIRLAASRHGDVLWRNNSGAGQDSTGRLVRFGLGNDSAQVNAVRKSPDLVGIRPRLIEPWMVGYLIGQFVGIEVKRGGWKFSAKDEHAVAQQRFGDDIVNHGGLFMFASDVSEVYK